jgi:predicted transposase/invertase (TIGR01784 family)
MTPELQTFAKQDAGFRQFCEQYNRVASDPKTRREYLNWCGQMMIDATKESMIRAESRAEGRAEGITEGIAKGIAKGQREKALEDAKAVLALGHTPEEVAKALGLPLADVKALL